MKDMVDTLPGLEPIRRRFLSLLEDRQAQVATHALRAWENETPCDANEELGHAQRILHQIAGTAGSLGFADLGASSKKCENAIIQHIDESGDEASGVPAELIMMLDGFVAECRDVITNND